MKLILNNKTPVLTKQEIPSYQCPTTCCFNTLRFSPFPCYRFFQKQCNKDYSFTLQDKVDEIFKL